MQKNNEKKQKIPGLRHGLFATVNWVCTLTSVPIVSYLKKNVKGLG